MKNSIILLLCIFEPSVMFFICLYLQDNERVLESLQDCDYDVDATIAYVLQTMETMQCK